MKHGFDMQAFYVVHLLLTHVFAYYLSQQCLPPIVTFLWFSQKKILWFFIFLLINSSHWIPLSLSNLKFQISVVYWTSFTSYAILVHTVYYTTSSYKRIIFTFCLLNCFHEFSYQTSNQVQKPDLNLFPSNWYLYK